MSENQAVPGCEVAPIERTVIEIPVALAGLIRGLTARASALLGETVEECRRGVEITILMRGCSALDVELQELAEQSEKMGWPK
jgi:hypothetical protein